MPRWCKRIENCVDPCVRAVTSPAGLYWGRGRTALMSRSNRANIAELGRPLVGGDSVATRDKTQCRTSTYS